MGLFGPSKKESSLQNEINDLKSKLLPEQQNIVVLQGEIISLSSEKSSLESAIKQYTSEISEKKAQIYQLDKDVRLKQSQIYSLNDDISMQEYGLYKPTFEFATSDKYMDRLKAIRNDQKQCIRDGVACVGDVNWQINGSTSKGKKMIHDMQKLLLRSFNVECDNIVDMVKISNVEKSKTRIYSTSEQISKLGNMMSISISPRYIELKIHELMLALDYQQKKQIERDRIMELREQEREERKIQKQIEEARKNLKKEEAHYRKAMDSLLEQIQKNGETPELIEKRASLLAELDDTIRAIQDVDYREANKKAGYVYIISNIGAFGENVYKIGMTRRLEPMERVDELGDASVPFKFDVHALIFTEDAPALENALHVAFEAKKINKINKRREFFRVTLAEIKAVVHKNFDKTVEWIDFPEAEQYRQSLL